MSPSRIVFHCGLVLFLLTLGAATASVNNDWLEGSAETRKRFDDIQGKPAPALAVEAWHNGEAVKLADLKGKVVLLDFWATWSTSCIDSIRRTNELQEKYKDQGLLIIGVCHAVGAEKVPQIVKDHGIQYRVASDVEGKTNAAYKVDSYPDYYLIDRAGNLRIADCRNASVEEAVRALLAEPEAQATAK